MSLNPIYDIIEDEIIRSLERYAHLPESFTIHLEPEQFKAMLSLGLQVGNERLPADTSKIIMTVADRRVMVCSDPEKEQTNQ
jgi:hypothetical protein